MNEQASALLSAVRCPHHRGALQCLQQVDVGQLQEAATEQLPAGTLAFGPRVDGHFLPATIETLLPKRHLLELDLIVGWNSDEGSLALLIADSIWPERGGVDVAERGLTLGELDAGLDKFQLMVFSKRSSVLKAAIRNEYSIERPPPLPTEFQQALSRIRRPWEHGEYVEGPRKETFGATVQRLGATMASRQPTGLVREQRNALLSDAEVVVDDRERNAENFRVFMNLFGDVWMKVRGK